MRIESIEIQNFRQYRKENIIFPKLKGKKDIHVIIGENGEGKTNILNALTWCLYGEELHLGDKNTAINKINSQYVQELRNHSQKNGETKVTVVMSIEDGGKITFMRTALYSITQSNVIETKQDVIAIANENGGNKIIEKKMTMICTFPDMFQKKSTNIFSLMANSWISISNQKNEEILNPELKI